ncbi:hypothetical protein Tco_1115692 [Tanacetum coccineum]
MLISREESNRGVPKSCGVSESKMNATSFVAKSFNTNRRKFNNNNNTRGSTSNNNVNRGPNPNMNYKNNGDIGYTIERCYELFRFQLGFKKFASTSKQTFIANVDVKNDKQSALSPSSSGFTTKQINKLLSLINDNTSISLHANMTGRPCFFNGNV